MSNKTPPTEAKMVPDWENADPADLEPYFSRWMLALTTEGLHDKADIATVLAMQSKAIAESAERVRRLEEELARRKLGPSGCACKIDDEGETVLRFCMVHATFRDRAESAERRLAEAQKDAERLDKLDKTADDWTFKNQKAWNLRAAEHLSIREAIDALSGAAPEEKKQ